MTGAWLEWLGAASLMLLIVAVLWLVGGFLADSLRTSEATSPDPPATRKSLIRGAVVEGAILFFWAYVLSGELRDAEGRSIFIGLLSFGIAMQTYLIFRKLIEAFRLGSAGIAPPQA
ncbi:hypothetical protein [Erythrobacter sp. CCH5-A1]|jgi:hypothetical protein|uniref:hypothetical protein n=1 Tax=Erythrobacter sp. CCH5-A1 TaxID=1768792 RepID=UPI00082FE947|nr:hypothetical protein [Erythrobacter sp. CCH5-A1]